MCSRSKSVVLSLPIIGRYTDVCLIGLTLTKYQSTRYTRWRSSEYWKLFTTIHSGHVTDRQMLKIVKSLIHEQLCSSAVQ